jgi:hypothetical protein
VVISVLVSAVAGAKKTGHMIGTPLFGALEWFVARYGKAAAHELVVRMSARWPGHLQPHAPALGILAARRYEYAFVGDLMRAAAVVAKEDEDAFIRESAKAGVDAVMGTIARVFVRYAATPSSLAARAQEAWTVFHDSGRVDVVVNGHDYVATIRDWEGHDVAVCKNAMEGRRYILERSGLRNVTARREKCQSWGHDVCVTRLRWE